MRNGNCWIAIYRYGDYPGTATYYDFQMWSIEDTGQDPDTFDLVGLVFGTQDSLEGINAHDIMTGKESRFPVLNLQLG